MRELKIKKQHHVLAGKGVAQKETALKIYYMCARRQYLKLIDF